MPPETVAARVTPPVEAAAYPGGEDNGYDEQKPRWHAFVLFPVQDRPQPVLEHLLAWTFAAALEPCFDLVQVVHALGARLWDSDGSIQKRNATGTRGSWTTDQTCNK